MMRAGMQVATIFQEHDGNIGLANLAGAFDDGLENRSDIGWRGRNYAENVCTSGLIGQRLLQLPGLGLHLFEQPNVRDGDDCLVGKS